MERLTVAFGHDQMEAILEEILNCKTILFCTQTGLNPEIIRVQSPDRKNIAIYDSIQIAALLNRFLK